MSLRRLVVVLAVCWSPAASAESPDWPTIAAAARRATFDVLVEDRHFGTGFFADATGLGFTGAHVVAIGDRRLELLLPDGTRAKAEVLARDIGHDLALVRAVPREAAYDVLPIAEAEPRVGDELALYGTPLHRRQLMLFGRVAGAGLGFEYMSDRQHYVECRHVSGTGPKGTSGGPWINADGEVVGLQIGGVSLTTGWQGISYVSPAKSLRHVLETKKEQPTPTIRLAIVETWQQSSKFLENVPPGTDGLVVEVLDPNGPAARAGLLLGDIIVTADEKPTRFVADLLLRVRAKKDGELIALELLGRSGNPNRIVKVPVLTLIER